MCGWKNSKWRLKPHQRHWWSASFPTTPTESININHWGVAVKAGSVYLIFSKDQKLGRKRGTPIPIPPCASRILIPNRVLAGHRSPMETHKHAIAISSNHFHHSFHTRACLVFCVRRATTHPLHTFVNFLLALQSTQSHWCSLPVMASTVTSCHPPMAPGRIKGHTGEGNIHLSSLDIFVTCKSEA